MAIARALQAKYTASSEVALEVEGKRLTVNFARARACTEDQLKRVAEGARRKLRVRLPESISAEQLIQMLGHKAEQLVDSSSLPLTEAEMSQSLSEAEGKEAADSSSPPPPATHALRLDFSSVSAAIAVKGSLEALTGASAVSGVEFVVEPVMSPEEIQAMLPATPAAVAEPEEAEGEETTGSLQAEALE